ncbi:MAG TPA: T9SS type A sorting domain-containing protein [Bacteroidales bacterium]|nr:T9SS type A sorting domain-containing protein [Bacteroidales bacterium]HSA42248.1 T9SS type A sorting domain-containing protein [Bacteroidales bacterium]
MKQAAFSISLLLMPAMLICQPTLTSWDVNPAAGEVVTLHHADPAGFNPGTGGAGISWNFDYLTPVSTSGFYYVDAALTPYGYLFPQANLAQNNGNNNFGYLQVNNFNLSYCGAYASNGATIYTNPENLLIFPFSYTSFLTDHFAASFSAGGNHYIRQGVVNTNADGYGTLILPWGTVNNVLRVHSLENYSDSTSTGITYITADIYLWYKGGTHHPVVTYRNVISGTGSDETLTYLDPVCVGTDQRAVDQNCHVFPNPASDKLHLDLITEPGKEVMVSLTSLPGDEILVRMISQDLDGQISFDLDLGQVSPGLYLLNIHHGREKTIRKVVVQK